MVKKNRNKKLFMYLQNSIHQFSLKSFLPPFLQQLIQICHHPYNWQVSEESRLAALNATDWDVHRAIKLCRLDALLPPELCVDSVPKLTALYDCGWEVARAAGLLLATLQPPDDVMQVWPHLHIATYCFVW